MNKQAFILLLLMIPLNLFTEPMIAPPKKKADKKDKVIIIIIIPMDTKPEDAQMHSEINYLIHESGKTYNWRYVKNWAFQAQQAGQLTKEEMKKVREIIDSLPKGLDEFAPDQLLKIIEYTDDLPKIRIYNRMKLPPKMEQLFELLGGVRFELNDKIGYDEEEKTK